MGYYSVTKPPKVKHVDGLAEDPPFLFWTDFVSGCEKSNKVQYQVTEHAHKELRLQYLLKTSTGLICENKKYTVY